MPQFLLLAAAGALALGGYRLMKQEMRRVGRSLDAVREAEAKALQRRGTLVRGADGVYRPLEPRD